MSTMKKISTLVLSLFLAAAFPAAWAQKSVLRSSITYEKMQANGVRLPVIGELVTQAPDINKQYWWSIGCETLDRDYADFDQFKDFFVDLGIGYARLQSPATAWNASRSVFRSTGSTSATRSMWIRSSARSTTFRHACTPATAARVIPVTTTFPFGTVRS